jgi:hypothetical protein
MVESTIVLAVCLFLLLGMLELSLALVRYTAMSEAARRIARAAIVHGSRSNAAQGIWGPAAIDTNAGSSHPAAAATRDVLMTLIPAEVAIRITWPDGGNRPDQRVHVAVSYIHEPMLFIPGWYSQLNMQADSTMHIAH